VAGEAAPLNRRAPSARAQAHTHALAERRDAASKLR
jgi:hypothetical protein